MGLPAPPAEETAVGIDPPVAEEGPPRPRPLDPVEVARIIKTEATPEAYQRRLPALREAKRRVLEEYNLFEIAYQMAKAGQAGGPVVSVTLNHERRSRPYGWYLRIKRMFG
jgi:hypothetical protein